MVDFVTKSVILDSDKKKELSEEQYDAYQLGWTDGDDILFLTKKNKQKKNRDGILQECKQEQGRKLTWDASPQYLFIREQRNPFILFDSLVASSLEPTPTSLSLANFRVIPKIISVFLLEVP